MAVLVEGLSVIIRKDAIKRSFRGGWRAFLRTIPNRTFCADEDLVRVGFMIPNDVQTYIDMMKDHGLCFLDQGSPVDIAVVDQLTGPTTKCDWLEFSRFPVDDSEGRISACWLFEGPRVGYGLHTKSLEIKIEVPRGWEYEGSLSQDYVFIPLGEEMKQSTYLESKDGIDVYYHTPTGKIRYVSRPFSKNGLGRPRKPDPVN